MRFPKYFFLTQEERDQTKSIIKTMLAQESDLILAYLYGSFMSPHGFNDIDMAVLVDEVSFKNTSEIFDYKLELALRIERELPRFPVDIIALNIAPLPLRFRIVSDGELLLSKNERRRVEFETRTRTLFFDFLPHLDFYYDKMVLGR